MNHIRLHGGLRAPIGVLAACLWLCVAYVAGGVYAQLAQGSVLGGKHAINKAHGFDTCDLPSTEQMKYLMEETHFHYLGFYLGDRNGCQNNPDRQWFIENHRARGTAPAWSFLPIWLGAQPFCTTSRTESGGKPFYDFISENPSEIPGEAAIEVAHAIARSEKDGIAQGATIYYDIEGFETTKQGCLEHVKQYVEVWDKRMAKEGWESGIYGSSQASALEEYWGLEDRPNDVWIAEAPGKGQSVYGTKINEAHWTQHRFHQYTLEEPFEASHVALEVIDRDCAYGMADGSNEAEESECQAK